MKAELAANFAHPTRLEGFYETTSRIDRSPVQYAIVQDLEGFEALETEWNGLHHRCAARGNPFQSFGWCWHWARHFINGKSHRLHILSVRMNGRLIIVWPMVRERSKGLVSLRFIGTPLTQYGDILLDPGTPPDILEASWRQLRDTAGVDLVEFYKVREDAAIVPLLESIGAFVTQRDRAPFVDMSGAADYESFARARYNKKRRGNIKRLYRRFEEMASVEFEVAGEGPQAARLVDELFEMKRQWLREKAMLSRTLDDPRTLAFFRDAVSDPRKSTNARVTTLRCGEELIGAEISFAAGSRLCVHIIGHNTRHDRWSPGQLTTAMSLERSLADGYTCYDFLGPDAPFKSQWANGALAVNDLAAPTSWKGQLWARLYLGFGRGWLKSLYRNLPTPLRRMTASALPTFLAVAG